MLGRALILVAAFSMGMPLSDPGQDKLDSVAVPVLVYHRFNPQEAGPTTVKTSTLKSQLAWLAEHGYKIVPLAEVIQFVRDGRPPEPGAVAITVDDGHRSVFTEMFPVIRQQRIPVTLFIYPSAISRASYALTWDELREMQRSGLVDVQSHTYWHPNFHREKTRRSPADYQAFVAFQLNHSRAVLEQQLGVQVNLLAWPFGIVDPELEQAAAHAGYIAAFAYTGGLVRTRANRFAIPRIAVSDRDRGEALSRLLHPAAERATP